MPRPICVILTPFSDFQSYLFSFLFINLLPLWYLVFFLKLLNRVDRTLWSIIISVQFDVIKTLLISFQTLILIFVLFHYNCSNIFRSIIFPYVSNCIFLFWNILRYFITFSILSNFYLSILYIYIFFN